MIKVVRYGFSFVFFLASCFCASTQTPDAVPLMPSKDALVKFLVKAKKSTYASQGDAATVKRVLLPGTHQLEFSDGPFFYRDIYVGSTTFAGQEIVYYAGKPIWSMSYAGDIPQEVAKEDVEGLVKLLHKALMNVPESNPYRGPSEIKDGAYQYSNHAGGSFGSFFGEEEICRDGTVLYKLHYEGGLLR
ncbi:MAG: DUF5680 domain-containing protein [Terracidiphilus sp.]|jgi:hypothetical protein